MRLFALLSALLIGNVTSAPFGGRNVAFAAIKPGDKLPMVEMHWGFPPQFINLPEYCADQNVIIVGLPGAFTPTESSIHIPSYIENQEALKEIGVDMVIFYCVNDAAVMGVWMSKLELGGTMTQMFGDPSGEFTRACGMEMTDPSLESIGLIGRSKRFAMHVVNNIVKYVAVSESDDDPAGINFPEATCAPAMIKSIKEANMLNV